MQQENQSTTPRIKEFGTWTEQTSSSGKRYYYNSATNVSQWEKPTEWKQAEKLRASTTTAVNQVKNGGGTGSSGQTPTEKVSPTSSTAVKPPQHPSVSVISSKNPIRHSSSSTFSAKPDSSGSAAHKSAAFGGNSASPNSGGPASKKARLEEDDGKVTSSSSTTLGHGNCGTISRKPVANISQPQVSSTTGSDNNRGEQAHSHSHTHHRVTAGGSGEHSGSGTPTSTTNKTRLGQYSAASADRISSNSRGTPDYHKNVSPAAAGVTMDKSNQGSGTHYSPLTSTKPRPLMSINTSSSSFATGKDPRQQQPPSSIVTNGMAATEEQEKVKEKRHEKASTPTNEAIFREDKYQKYWRPDLATASRRTLGIDSFAFEVKKCADRTGKQMITAFALDRDINSIRTLDRCALLRTELCKQRLDTVQQRIQELESKSGGGAGQ